MDIQICKNKRNLYEYIQICESKIEKNSLYIEVFTYSSI